MRSFLAARLPRGSGDCIVQLGMSSLLGFISGDRGGETARAGGLGNAAAGVKAGAAAQGEAPDRGEAPKLRNSARAALPAISFLSGGEPGGDQSAEADAGRECGGAINGRPAPNFPPRPGGLPKRASPPPGGGAAKPGGGGGGMGDRGGAASATPSAADVPRSGGAKRGLNIAAAKPSAAPERGAASPSAGASAVAGGIVGRGRPPPTATAAAAVSALSSCSCTERIKSIISARSSWSRFARSLKFRRSFSNLSVTCACCSSNCRISSSAYCISSFDVASKRSPTSCRASARRSASHAGSVALAAEPLGLTLPPPPRCASLSLVVPELPASHGMCASMDGGSRAAAPPTSNNVMLVPS
mmetsp:Transcript_52531/g.151400  ORF Transcript_52531/g.151400 Transcript_52531/m.151400 type:complete len:358 (+) Transcript_52531:807-1880(+)